MVSHLLARVLHFFHDVQARILIAEPYADIATLEAALLTLRGHEVDVCTDPVEWISKVRNGSYHAVIIGTPDPRFDHDGFDDLLEPLSDYQRPRTILITTQISDEELIARAERARLFAVLGKPLAIADLANVVAACIANDGRPAGTRRVGVVSRAHYAEASASVLAM